MLSSVVFSHRFLTFPPVASAQILTVSNRCSTLGRSLWQKSNVLSLNGLESIIPCTSDKCLFRDGVRAFVDNYIHFCTSKGYVGQIMCCMRVLSPGIVLLF